MEAIILFNMIILFSSNSKGGVLQFVSCVANELIKQKRDVRIFLPKDSKVSLNDQLERRLVPFDKSRSVLFFEKRIKKIASSMLEHKPSLIWYFDTTIISSEVSLNIPRAITQMMILHDPVCNHPTYDFSTLKLLNHLFRKVLTCLAFIYSINYVIILSQESLSKVSKTYCINKKKLRLLNLGAHIPEIPPRIPRELNRFPIKSYFLFFGRFDKYKGILTALKAFSIIEQEDYKSFYLVIAGEGNLSPNEKDLSQNHRVVLINRYIDDDEMVYLFMNSSCLLLPYIECSQSGIIPISYYYGKPVIVSALPGLTQFVKDGQTGYVAGTACEFADRMKLITELNNSEMSENCLKYYRDNLEWNNNLSKLFDSLS